MAIELTEDKEQIRYVVYTEPGIICLTDEGWQREMGINFRFKRNVPVDLFQKFSARQINSSGELASAIERGSIRVLTREEFETFSAEEGELKIAEGGRVEQPDDIYMRSLAEFEDKEEQLDGELNKLRITPRERGKKRR